MPRSKPASKPPADDDTDDNPIQRRRTQAGTTPPPATTAASSVFALGAKAKPRRAPAARLDPSAIQIRSGAPIPEKEAGGPSAYIELLGRMKPGDMVELTDKQMYAMVRHAKRTGVQITRRRLDSGLYGIWRM